MKSYTATTHLTTKLFAGLTMTVITIVLWTASVSLAEASTVRQTTATVTAPFAVATFNVLGAGPQWSGTTTPTRFWDNRLPDIRRTLREGNFDIIGFQEFLTGRTEFNDISKILRGYRSTRPDTWHLKINTVFYKPTVFRMIDHGSIPLTNVDGNRSAVWVLFEHIRTKQQFYFYNTHLGHAFPESRRMGAELIVADIKKRNTRNLPIIMTGDFNIDGRGKGLPTTIFAEVGLLDVKEMSLNRGFASKASHFEYDTFHALEREPRKNGEHIDKIYVTNRVLPRFYRVLVEYDRNLRPSDHFPVVSVMQLQVGTTTAPRR